MIYADLHVHIGRSLNGKPVKITAAKTLTLPQALQTADRIKGLSLLGIIDAHSLGVREDFRYLIKNETLRPLAGGGYAYGSLSVIPGTEVELEIGNGTAHFLAYFSSIEQLEMYIRKIYQWVKNWQLGSQKMHLPVEGWLEAVELAQGIWMPAHVFTPHKGIYGNCCERLTGSLTSLPAAIELGLSADSSMAKMISELDEVIFLSNSDAHSLPKIAREFNLLKLGDCSFMGLKDLFTKKNGTVLKNFGLPPAMGKYHRSYCPECREILVNSESVLTCPTCHTAKVIPGVFDRVVMIADREQTKMSSYVYHIPLMELPGVGPRTYQSLLKNFGNEIEILHEVPLEDLRRKVGEQLTRLIALMRKGEIEFEPGGGGIFGKIITP